MDYEKLVTIDQNEEENIKIKKSLRVESTKSSTQKFFTTYRNRYLMYMMSSYLTDFEKISFLYLNRFTMTNLKRIFKDSIFENLKKKIQNHIKKGYNLRDLLFDDADLLKRILPESKDQKTSDRNATYVIIGKWLNKIFFQKKIKLVNEEGKESTSISFEKYIYFNNGDLKTLGAILLLYSIVHNNEIEELDLSKNQIPESVLNTFKIIFSRPKPLKRLIIDDNNLGGEEGISNLVNTFKNMSSLNFLNISNISLREEGAMILSNNFSHLPHLQTLYLDENKIGSKGCGNILISLKTHKHLYFLSFKNTNLDYTLSGYLSIFFTRSYRLANLNLSSNNFGLKFFKLIENLNIMKIRDLDLSKCYLDDSSAEILLSKLSKNTNLHYLNLNENFLVKSEYIKSYLLKTTSLKGFQNSFVSQKYYRIVFLEDMQNFKKTKQYLGSLIVS
jgi:hypothetical protein